MADVTFKANDGDGNPRHLDNALVTNDQGVEAYRQKVVAHLPAHFDVVYGTTSAAAGTFVEVVSHIPAGNDVLLVGVGCDMASILTATYRFRVTVGGDIKFQEVVTTTANSWVPIKLKVPDGTAVAVEVRHGEATAQDVSATINYQTL